MSTGEKRLDDRPLLSAMLLARALVELDIDVPGQLAEFFRDLSQTLPPRKRELVQRLLGQNANATLRDFAEFETSQTGGQP